MSVDILIPTALRTFTGGKDTVAVEATTVDGALQSLTETYPSLKKHLYNNDGQLRNFVNLYLNDEDVRYLDEGAKGLKTGDTLSKVGDPVNYTITVTNTSSNDTPNLVNGTITDTLLGNLLDPANPFVTDKTCTATLATTAGVDSCVIHATRTVQAGDADPLPNTVTVHYNPSGFPNDITANDSHSVNLFQPSFTVTKTADELSKLP